MSRNIEPVLPWVGGQLLCEKGGHKMHISIFISHSTRGQSCRMCNDDGNVNPLEVTEYLREVIGKHLVYFPLAYTPSISKLGHRHIIFTLEQTFYTPSSYTKTSHVPMPLNQSPAKNTVFLWLKCAENKLSLEYSLTFSSSGVNIFQHAASSICPTDILV